MVEKSREMRDKISKKDFINSFASQAIVELSHSHTRYLMFFFFRERIENKDIVTCPKVKEHLTNLCMLYGLHQLHTNSKNCYDSGYFQSGHSISYTELLMNAIKLVN